MTNVFCIGNGESQQLMNPKQNNSNIYMPQTQRCTVSGFGATSVVRCY